MYDLTVDGVTMAIISFLAALLVTDDGHGMAVAGTAGCFGMVNGLGMHGQNAVVAVMVL